MNKHNLINQPFFRHIHTQTVDLLVHEAITKLRNPKIKLTETADFDYFYEPHVALPQAYYVACRYLYIKHNVEPKLEPIIQEFEREYTSQMEQLGSYDYGLVNQLISDTIYAFNSEAKLKREAYKSAKETQDTIKRFINDGRVQLSDLYLDQTLDLYVFDALFEYKPKRTEVYVKRVPCSELRDIPEALLMVFNNHPTKLVNKLPSFSIRINTLKKPHTAIISISPYSTWHRFKPSVADAILADREGYVRVTSFNREAFNTNYEYLDQYDIQIVDPELED